MRRLSLGKSFTNKADDGDASFSEEVMVHDTAPEQLASADAQLEKKGSLDNGGGNDGKNMQHKYARKTFLTVKKINSAHNFICVQALCTQADSFASCTIYLRSL
jgi:hypothetical protein